MVSERTRGESRRLRRGVAGWKRERSSIGEREVRKKERESERKTDREDHRSCRIRSHVIGIVDSVLRLSEEPFLPRPSCDLSPTLVPQPLFLSCSLSPVLFVSATHARSRGYVVEPPRGHRIIIGWQVTRTLSPGFNWPIIVARIDGAAGPDRRETFGVACSPSDTTRLSVTNISWQEGANARADRGN